MPAVISVFDFDFLRFFAVCYKYSIIFSSHSDPDCACSTSFIVTGGVPSAVCQQNDSGITCALLHPGHFSPHVLQGLSFGFLLDTLKWLSHKFLCLHNELIESRWHAGIQFGLYSQSGGKIHHELISCVQQKYRTLRAIQTRLPLLLKVGNVRNEVNVCVPISIYFQWGGGKRK